MSNDIIQTEEQSSDEIRDEPSALIAIGYATRSLWQVNSDEQLKGYLSSLQETVANRYGKELTEVSIRDVERVIKKISKVARRLNLDVLTWAKALVIRDSGAPVFEAMRVVRWATAIAELASGAFAPIFSSFARDSAGKRVKNATIVFLVSYFYCMLYDEETAPSVGSCIDPIFTAMSSQELDALGKLLSIERPEGALDHSFATVISKKVATEARDQSLSRAWFPRPSESYAEVVIVVAKRFGVKIQGLMTIPDIERALLQQVLPVAAKLQAKDILSGILGSIEPRTKSEDSQVSMLVAASLKDVGLAVTSTSYPFLAAVAGLQYFEKVRARPEKLVTAIAFIAAWRDYHSKLASRIYEEAQDLQAENSKEISGNKSVRVWRLKLVLLVVVAVLVGAGIGYLAFR